jgi:Uma2 family endonuclease
MRAGRRRWYARSVVGFARPRFTFEDYLALEDGSPSKHEFLDGSVWAMAGGTPDHAAIAANIIASLGSQLLDRPCRVYTSDLRVRVSATGLATYPDVTVVCGARATDPEDSKGNTVVNPKVIVEVLSPSTEDYDRGEKLAHYKKLASLEEILLVAHDAPRVERWYRRKGRWALDVAEGEATLALPSIDCSLSLARIFATE